MNGNDCNESVTQRLYKYIDKFDRTRGIVTSKETPDKSAKAICNLTIVLIYISAVIQFSREKALEKLCHLMVTSWYCYGREVSRGPNMRMRARNRLSYTRVTWSAKQPYT